LHRRSRRDAGLRDVAESATAERLDEKTAFRDVLGRAQRLGACQPEHRDEAGPIQCRDEQDIFDRWSHWDHRWEQRQVLGRPWLARSLQQLGAGMLVRQEKDSLPAHRVAMGLQVLSDA
jgi:hypothetical protein